MSGFGGRTYVADGMSIRVQPIEREAYGVTRITVGFPFATMSDYVDQEIAEALAEYLSCPMRAAAPDLCQALQEAFLAMETIARRVFNDNGDHTIDTSPLHPDVFSACYYASRAAMDALAKARGASS